MAVRLGSALPRSSGASNPMTLADFPPRNLRSRKQEKENDIHSIRTEVVAHRAAKSSPGHSSRSGLRTRTIHELPEVHRCRPGAGGPVVVAGPAIYSQRQWTS